MSLASNPEEWERGWQRKLDQRYPAYRKKIPSMISDLDFSPNGALRITEVGLQQSSQVHGQLCRVQADIAALASEKCATDDFEARWRACSTAERKKHYFAAMSKVLEHPDMETQRTFAPEVSLQQFQSNSGQGYIQLMRRFLPADRIGTKTNGHYIHLEHPLVDSMFDIQHPFDTSNAHPPNPKVQLQRGFIINRHLFISLTVYHILLSFYGRSERLVPTKLSNSSNLTREAISALEKMGISKKEIEAIKQEDHATRRTVGQYLCEGCNKPEEMTGGATFKACSRCAAIGRPVKYCSRECQVSHWKSGNPPHKTVCGKSQAGRSALATATPTPADPDDAKSESSIPPPSPGYCRSPALLHQISLLDENTDFDYVLTRPAPHPDHGIRFADPMGRLMFILMRNRAFSAHNPHAVSQMYNYLKNSAKNVPDYSFEDLQKQLLAEYGVDVTKAKPSPATKSDITEEEI